MAGQFFSFDGVDGAGKTTQLKLFAQWLEQAGYSVTTCRDPGGTALGEAIRQLLLHRTDVALSVRSEMLLYMASRAQLVAEVIQPALEAGTMVVADRFLLANVVYQGHAAELLPDDVWQVGRVATNGTLPDLTFLLDLDAEQACARLQGELDRMESRGEHFLKRVREGFLAEAAANPNAIEIVNATASIDEIQATIRARAERMLRSDTS